MINNIEIDDDHEKMLDTIKNDFISGMSAGEIFEWMIKDYISRKEKEGEDNN
jgi:hypothetical protein